MTAEKPTELSYNPHIPLSQALLLPRIVIENTMPTLDGGQFAVKAVVDQDVVVTSKVFADGHDKLAVRIRWRAEGDDTWQSEVMAELGNNGWQGQFRVKKQGRYTFCIEAWIDQYASFCYELKKKHEACMSVSLELQEGRLHVQQAAERSEGHLSEQLIALHRELSGLLETEQVALFLHQRSADLMAQADHRPFVSLSPEYPVDVERELAQFASWYELFPRSITDDPTRHGTFNDVHTRLAMIQDMGFDVLYFTPIHPIGRSYRKGPNNSLTAGPDDPGSPYAIGSEEGGHEAIHSELGSREDFRRLVAAAAEHGLEVALDFAIQCSQDHPWLKEHPGWFNWRPDGTIKYAENPPKKYEDIVNVDFYNPDREGLWRELRDTVLFWVDQGVRTFRVDNPHTKPVPFWEWMIREVKARCPGAVFLAEAFTRPKMMRLLAKAGFSQSYTYFTWRNTKGELTEYLTELTQGPGKEYYRPNFFANTPDILPVFLQEGGRPAFRIRLALAGTLSPAYGIYNGFELCENAAIPGREEYIHSEKYEYKVWDWDRPTNIKRDVAVLNRFRRGNPALHELTNLRFLECPDPNMLAYAKATADHSNIVIAVVNLDPHGVHGGMVTLPLHDWGIAADQEFSVEEAFTGRVMAWRGERQHLVLDPDANPAMLFRVLPIRAS